MASKCLGCGHVHADYGLGPGDDCGRVRRLAALAAAGGIGVYPPAGWVANTVANADPVANEVANNEPATVANRRSGDQRSGDRHVKTNARKAYMRDLMRRRRAEKKG